jgi:hypothetical protein
MNKIIRKIAIETDAWCDQNWLGHTMYNLRWEEKFAELIVRECAIVAAKHNYENEGMTLCVDEALYKHFGIEE